MIYLSTKTLLILSLLVGSSNFVQASSSSENKDDFVVLSSQNQNTFEYWDATRQRIIPQFNTTYIQGYNSKNIESIKEAVLLAQDGQKIFHELLKGQAYIRNTHLKAAMKTAYTEDFCNALRGLLLTAENQNTEASKAFSAAGSALSPLVQEEITNAAAIGRMGFDSKTGKKYIKERILLGDKYAQKLEDQASRNQYSYQSAYYDELRTYMLERSHAGDEDAQGVLEIKTQYEIVSAQKRYLEERVANHQDEKAQKLLNQAAKNGDLDYSPISGRQYLEDRIKYSKDLHAQQMINEAAKESSQRERSNNFGFTIDTGRQYLENRVNQNKDLHAQQMLNEAAAKGQLGFLPDTGRNYLKVNSNAGDKHAQKLLTEAASTRYGRLPLAFTIQSALAHLKESAESGDDYAQQKLNEAAMVGGLGFTSESGWDYLQDRVNRNNDQHAQQMLNEAAKYRYFGFTPETGRAYLEDRAMKGDQHAQKML